MKDELNQLKVALQVERREDGGVRISSKDLPGLILSGHDVEKVFADVLPAVQVLLSARMGCEVRVSWLLPVGEAVPARPVTRPSVRKPVAAATFERKPFNPFAALPKRLELAAACG